MQQWEYHNVYLSKVIWGNSKGWRLWKIEEQEQPNWKKGKVYLSVTEFCNEMGQQGWELLSAAYPGKAVIYAILHFKRLRIESRA